eukprot:1848370-Rhodomonas_salina.1
MGVWAGLDGGRGDAFGELLAVLTPHSARRIDRPSRKPKPVETLRVGRREGTVRGNEERWGCEGWRESVVVVKRRGLKGWGQASMGKTRAAVCVGGEASPRIVSESSESYE